MILSLSTYHVAANRQREPRAIIAHGETQSTDWLDEDEVDLLGVLIPWEINESAWEDDKLEFKVL